MLPLVARLLNTPLFMLTAFGLFGFGYMAAGLTLIFKHVESLTNVLINLHALWNETYKTLLHYWSYRANLVIEVFAFTTVFIGISFWLGDGESTRLETRA